MMIVIIGCKNLQQNLDSLRIMIMPHSMGLNIKHLS